MNREDDPQLWDLLSRSEPARPSPFFARNVLRAVRNDSAQESVFAGWLTLRRFAGPLSAVAAIIVAVSAVQVVHYRQRAALRGHMFASQDPEMAADLDVLTADDDDDASLL